MQKDSDLVDLEATKSVIDGLTRRFGRVPTEDEVMSFIFGTKEIRKDIWDKKGLDR